MKRKRKKIPGKLRKRKKRELSVAAQSAKTGITHFFGDISKTEKLAKKLEQTRLLKTESELINAISFYNWLKGAKITTRPAIQWENSVYRLTYGRNPLSILGSISDGGRFNVGGAQVCPEIPEVEKRGAIYAASSITCCRKELSGNPIGIPDEFELQPSKTYLLWDLEQVIIELNHPGLEDGVKATPFEAIWAYQKVPLYPQILAHFLRAIGGDGLVYPSVKDPTEKNFCFFFEDDSSAQLGFKVRKLN